MSVLKESTELTMERYLCPKCISHVKEFVPSPKIPDQFTTIQKNCRYCKKRRAFGFKDRRVKCDCITNKSDHLKNLIKWLNYRRFGLAIDSEYNQIVNSLVEKRANLTEIMINPHVLDPLLCSIRTAVNIFCNYDRYGYLDIGCGDMNITRYIASSLNVFPQGVDIIDRREQKHLKEDLAIYDGQNLPFGNSNFNLITCLNTLHHTKNPRALLKSVADVLIPGGILVISEYDCQSWNMAYSLDLLHSALSEVLNDETYVTEYRSREEWRKLCDDIGFRPIHRLCDRPKNSYGSYVDIFIKKQFY